IRAHWMLSFAPPMSRFLHRYRQAEGKTEQASSRSTAHLKDFWGRPLTGLSPVGIHLVALGRRIGPGRGSNCSSGLHKNDRPPELPPRQGLFGLPRQQEEVVEEVARF